MKPTLLILIALGVVLRFVGLTHQSFWYDETASAVLAAEPLLDSAMGRALDVGNPPLYIILLHLWSSLFGTGDTALRTLSAVASVATLLPLFVLVRRHFGERIALVTVAITGLAPYHVYLAQEARAYSLVGLLSVLSWLALSHALENTPRRARWWALYAVATFAGMYTHYFYAFLVFAQVGYTLLAHRQNRRALTEHALGLVAAFVLFLFWLPAFVEQVTTSGNLGRSAESWYLHVAATPLAYSAGTTLLWKELVSPLRIALGVVSVLAALGAAAFGARALNRLGDRRPLKLVLLWLLTPVLLPLVISVALFPFYNIRYVFIAAPAF